MTWRRLVWLDVTDVSNDRSLLTHRIEQSKIQLGYFFDCWALNMKVLMCFETSASASPTTQRNISEDLNSQQKRCESLKKLISENLHFDFRCALFWLCPFERKILTALKNVYHQSERLDGSSSHFLVSCEKYKRFSLTTTWPTLVTKFTNDLNQPQTTSSLHIICRTKAVCFLSKICWHFVGSPSEPRSRDFYHSFPKFTPVILKSRVFTSM